MLHLWTQILMGRFHRSEKGQGTIEYVLVILAVAAVALVLITWGRGQGGGVLSTLFSKVLGFVIGKIRF